MNEKQVIKSLVEQPTEKARQALERLGMEPDNVLTLEEVAEMLTEMLELLGAQLEVLGTQQLTLDKIQDTLDILDKKGEAITERVLDLEQGTGKDDRNVILVFELVPERTSVFCGTVTKNELSMLQKFHGLFINCTENKEYKEKKTTAREHSSMFYNDAGEFEIAVGKWRDVTRLTGERIAGERIEGVLILTGSVMPW